jgi:hypothetical protein
MVVVVSAEELSGFPDAPLDGNEHVESAATAEDGEA